MHILYIHQYFSTPRGSTGTRSYEFSRRWVAAGHRVTMLTSLAQLTAEDLGPGPHPRVVRAAIDGIDVVALNVPYRQQMGRAARMQAFLRFMMGTLRQIGRCGRVDVIYATSTPLTVGVPALWARRRRAVPFVFEVRDMWPAIPAALGAIRSPAILATFERLERTIYRNAVAVVALSPGAAAMVRRHCPAGIPVATIPNCADTDFFRPDMDGTEVRRRLGWGRRVVLIHTGAMGRINGLDGVVRAADRLRHDAAALFLLVGDGSEKAGLLAEKRRLGLDNLQILDALPKRELPGLLAAADVGLMTVAPVPILEHNSANKFFDYLAAGRPILMNYGGWKRQLLEDAGAGLGCDLGDEAAFTRNIAELAADAPRRRAMGAAARRLAEERFNRDALAAEALRVLEQAVVSP